MIRRVLRHPLPWILLLAVLLRWQAAGAFRSSDDLDYALGARDLLEGRYRPDSFHQLRLGVILPTAVSFGVFGIRPVAAILWPLVSSLLGIAVLFRLVESRSSRLAASLAALFLAVSTQHVLSGAELFPDAPLVFWILLGFLLYLGERDGAGRAWGYALAGLCFYAAFATRIETVKLVPAFAAVEAWFIRRKGVDRKAAWIACGALVPLLLEVVFFGVVAGHPLARIRELTAVGDWARGSGSHNMGLWPMVKSLVSPLGAFGLLVPVAAAGAIRLRRERRLGILLFLSAYFLATALLAAGLYNLADGRHYTLLSPFVAWLAAELVAASRLRIAGAVGLAFAGLLLTHARLPSDTVRAYGELRELAVASGIPLYADARTVEVMNFYFPGTRAVRYENQAPQPPCWLVDHARFRAIDRSMYGRDAYPGDRGTLVRTIPLRYRGLPGFTPLAQFLFRWRGVGGIEEIRVFRID